MRGALEGADSLEVMYDLDGRPVPEEQVLEHLAGHRGSTPVRIGNGAKGQLQLDVAGRSSTPRTSTSALEVR